MNMDIWDKVKRPPQTALKTIKAGRLSGMTDINPQWRLQVMTEMFGQCGVGWHYTIERTWTEPGANGELMAFVLVHLHTKTPEGWSAPIVGIGGSALVAKETSGLRANDEAYKMATTDALSVAMKQLGVAADIYMGLWDGSKYKDTPPEPKESSKSIARSVWDSLPVSEQTFLTGIAVEMVAAIKEDNMAEACRLFYKNNLDQEEQTALWSRFDSTQRAAIKSFHAAQNLDA